VTFALLHVACCYSLALFLIWAFDEMMRPKP
jgi:hypothetical protein